MLTSSTTCIDRRILDFDEREFQEKFPKHGFKIRHHLCDMPAFQLPRLADLAQRLPENLVEFYAGDVPVNQDLKDYPRNGLSASETVRRIEECGSWMVLKNVGVDLEYGELLRTLLDEVRRQGGSSIRGMHREYAFIFVSSPNSVTPFHLDDEHNFLLQIRGSKQVNMWDPQDRVVMPEPQAEHMMERYHPEGWQRYMPYQEQFQSSATVFDLAPGEGLHFPFGAPHWVKNGSSVSVSFSITWLSDDSERQAILYSLNKKLRRLRVAPTPPEQSGWRDSLKLGAYYAGKRTARALRGRGAEGK